MIFLTWQLWQWMRFPMWRHPIFQYARREAMNDDAVTRWQQMILSILGILLIAVIVFIPQFLLVIVLALVLGIPVFMVLFNGTLLGTVWITGVVSSIGDNKHANMLDLVKISPLGRLGAAWLFALAVVHRYNWLWRVYKVIKWLILVILTLLVLAIVALIAGIFMTSNSQLQQTQLNVLRDAIILSALAIMFWLDHIQSIVIAMVLGLALSSLPENIAFLRGIAPVIYIILQLLTCLSVIIVSLVCQSILQSLLGIPFLVSILTLGFSCASFVFLREMITVILLRVVLRIHDLTISEFQHVMTTFN